MTESGIQEHLYRHFSNYHYRLSNSFVYNWECDFFAMSKSNYFLECEIKISRSDFLIDFKKEKHKLFNAAFSGKSIITIDAGHGNGDLICTYDEGELIGCEPERVFDRQRKRTCFCVNDSNRAYIHHRKVRVYAPARHVRFVNLAEPVIPNQFYYAVPEGLIKPEEVPAYAGLLYCYGYGITMVKRAPYLTKNKMDLSKVLLKKFYNLWNYKTTLQEKLLVNENKMTV